MLTAEQRIRLANEPRPADFPGRGEEWIEQLRSREEIYPVPDKIWRPDEGSVSTSSRRISSPPPSSSSPPRRTSWTATELLAAEFPPHRWAVEGVVAEGVTVLAGPPKVGKSWLGLGLAVAVATGGRALGKVDVEAGDVLYLALEDTARRLQARLRKVLGRSPAPDRLTVATECPPLGAGGRERITAWLDGHPDARLVVIDVFARIRGRADRQLSPYDADYAPMAAVKALADQYAVAVVVLHHTRKASAEDFLDTVSGTQGIAGAADALLVLARSRGQADATLSVTGRDIEEAEYALTFAADLGAWQLLDGPAIEHTIGDTRRRILAAVREHGAMTPKQLAAELGVEHDAAKQTAHRMAKDGQIDTDGQGHYFPLSPVTPVTLSPKIAEGDSPGHLSPATPPLTCTGDTGDTGDSPLPATDTGDSEGDSPLPATGEQP